MPRRTSSRAIAVVSSVALVAGVGTALTGQPAAAAATITQTKTCVDGGGTSWTVKSTWGRVYTDRNGIRRVDNDVTRFTTRAPRVTRVEYTMSTYNADGRRIQELRRSNRRFDFRGGQAYLTRNVRDPRSGPGKTRIRVSVGVFGDGKSRCSVTFVQPRTGTPTATPSTPSSPSDRVYTTGYTWWDNSPPGSAAIAHPVVHRTAGGVGTYSDPVTLAVAYRNRTPQFPYGTRFYLPRWKKYFIVEDICGACYRVPAGARYKIDLWLDARTLSRTAAHRCAAANTGMTTAVRNPPRDLAVDRGRIC